MFLSLYLQFDDQSQIYIYIYIYIESSTEHLNAYNMLYFIIFCNFYKIQTIFLAFYISTSLRFETCDRVVKFTPLYFSYFANHG
jgi:hypothetical protein